MRRPWKGSEAFTDPAPVAPGSLAAIEDFELRHGPVVEAEKQQVEAILEDATALIEAELSGLPQTWVGEKAAVPGIVKSVCVECAYRAWSNPDALSSEALGEHTQAWADRSGQALRLTAAELRILERASGENSFVSVTIESPYAGCRIESDLRE